MQILIHESAEKVLNNLDTKIQKNIKDHLSKLSENLYSNQLDIKKLKGLKDKQDLFRLRVGEYRIIYFIQDNIIYITEIMIRGRGYDI